MSLNHLAYARWTKDERRGSDFLVAHDGFTGEGGFRPSRLLHGRGVALWLATLLPDHVKGRWCPL